MSTKDHTCRIRKSKRFYLYPMRFFVLTAAAGLFLFASIFRTDAVSGDLDPTFGTGGKVITVLPGDNEPRKIAVQPDGKIVLQGHNYDGDNESSFVARYDPDGTLDESFGTNGRVVFPNQTPSFEFFRDGLAVLADGKILICGSKYNVATNSTVLVVLRLNGNGSRDTSFGVGGTAEASFGIGNDRYDSGERLQVQPDGRIVVAGYAEKGCREDPWEGYYCELEGIGLVRFNTNGGVDTTFGTSGNMIIPDSTANSFFSIDDFDMSPDGKFLLIGQNVVRRADFRVFLSRINANGTLDTSFGTNGILVPDINEQVDIYRMAIQPDGKIVFPVFNNRNSPVYSSVVRLNRDGTADASFGTNGRIVIPATESLFVESVLIQSNGKIILGGAVLTNGAVSYRFAVLHLNADGSRDTTFGPNGIVTTLLLSYGGLVSDMALQPDGKLLAVGGVQNYDTDLDIGMARFLAPSVPGIAISGRVTTPDGRGLRNAAVSITDSLGVRRTTTTSSFGFYTFDEVRSGDTYMIGVNSRLYRFASRNLVLTESLTNVDFVGLE